MPDLYTPDLDWPRLPRGQRLGQVTSVTVDGDGQVYVLHRGSPPVLCFDRDGTLLRGWGDDHIQPGGGHFLRVDPDGHVWITETARHQLLKFTPHGALLLELGSRGVPGAAPNQFNQPTDVAFLPSGAFYVSDGYGNARIKQYTAAGELITTWGSGGRQPGEFDTPHALCLDSTGRLYISDRGNSRIQVFSGDGRYLSEWRGLPYIDGMVCAPDDTLYVTTGRSNGVLRLSTTEIETTGIASNPIVIESFGSRHCTHRDLIDHFVPPLGQFNMIHGIGLDTNGDVYVAEVRARRAQKLIRRREGTPQQATASGP